MKTNILKSKYMDKGQIQNFNPKNTVDPELQLIQIMLGKSMINILEFIQENIKDFSGL